MTQVINVLVKQIAMKKFVFLLMEAFSRIQNIKSLKIATIGLKSL